MSDAPTPEVDEHLAKYPTLNHREDNWSRIARRLQRERDEWKTKSILHGNAALELEQEVTSLRAINAELEEALERSIELLSQTWVAEHSGDCPAYSTGLVGCEGCECTDLLAPIQEALTKSKEARNG
jgi:hypothetical protein